MNASVNVTNKKKNNVPDVPSSTLRIKKKQPPKSPTKQVEFRKFIETLKSPGTKAHWQEVAVALGVSPDTITDWLKIPEAIQAKQEGIDNALAGMERAGRSDWKMYQAKLKMLNVKMNDEYGQGNTTNNTLVVVSDSLKSFAESLQR